MARYIAVRLDNNELSDEEAIKLLSDWVIAEERDFPGELSDVRIIHVDYQTYTLSS